MEYTWADRASQRGVALGYVSNVLITALAWSPMSDFYDPRVSRPALCVLLVAAGWFTVQTLRRRFRRVDFRLVVGTLLVALTLMAAAPTSGPPPSGWSWTQPWTVTTICGAVLLLPRRQAVPAVILISTLQLWIRAALVALGIALIESATAVVGALIVAWAARVAAGKFEQVRGAMRVAALTEDLLVKTNAEAHAEEWWNRLVHDKVLGALLLASRATSPTLLRQAREVAQDALHTLEAAQSRDIDESVVGSSAAGLSMAIPRREPNRMLEAGLAELATRLGLASDIRIRGRDGTTPHSVVEAVLAAAEQALRNVAQHSGQQAVRIRGEQGPSMVRVEIRDDGRGFDLGQVSGSRVGVRSSIPGHMAMVHGSAQVNSIPEDGTTVELSWSRQAREDRGSPMTTAQIRSWWWISALFSGLHVVGGLLAGGPLLWGRTGLLGLLMLIAAYSLMHAFPDGPGLVWGQVLILLGCALMLWEAPHSIADSWHLWFLGASHAALVLPALRGRPWLSLSSGVGLTSIIGAEFALRSPGDPPEAAVLAMPFIVVPAIAGLYAVMLARADTALRSAQDVQATARLQLHAAQARRDLVTARVTMLAPGTMVLLTKLVNDDRIQAADRADAKLLEAANRDYLVAGSVLTPILQDALTRARERGATVHLTSTAAEGSSSPFADDKVALQLAQFQVALVKLAASAMSGDELTARWQPTNSYAVATLALTASAADGSDRFIVLRGNGT